MKFELVMLPFIVNPFEIAYLLPLESKSTTGLPFSPDFPSCMWTIEISVMPVIFNLYLMFDSLTFNFTFPSAFMVTQVGTLFSPFSFDS